MSGEVFEGAGSMDGTEAMRNSCAGSADQGAGDTQVLADRAERTLLALETSEGLLHRREFSLESQPLGLESLVDPFDAIVLGVQQRLVLVVRDLEEAVELKVTDEIALIPPISGG